MLSGWTFAVTLLSRALPDAMVARVIGVLGLVSTGFLLFILLTSNPFQRLVPAAAEGRDLNPHCFPNGRGGGGIKGGVSHGESDEWGYKPHDRLHPTQVYDIPAAILHQLGLDHTNLTLRSHGIDRRLTDVHGEVIHEIVG